MKENARCGGILQEDFSAPAIPKLRQIHRRSAWSRRIRYTWRICRCFGHIFCSKINLSEVNRLEVSMALILAPFYLLFGVLYLGGTIIGLFLAGTFFLFTELRFLFSREWLFHGLLHRSLK